MFDVPSVFLPDIIAGHARTRPAKLALVCDDANLTWRQFDDAINAFARYLAARGIGRGHRVAVLAEPTAAAMIVQFGTLRAGACVASVSGMASSDALARMIADSAPNVLVADEHFSDFFARAVTGAPSAAPDLRIRIGSSPAGWLGLEEVLTEGSAMPPRAFTRIEGEDEFVILYSSGTTGVPKGIVLSHACRLANCWLLAVEQRYDSNAVVFSATALYSNTTWTLVTLALFVGGTAVVMRKFEAKGALDLLRRWRVSHTILVPAVLRMVLDAESEDPSDLSAIRMVCTTGSQMPLALKQRTICRFPGAYFEVYGLTEGLILILKPEDAQDHIDSVGKPMLGNDIRIVDDGGAEMPAGRKGEIVGYGPLLMRGYNRRPEATEEAIWRDAAGRTFVRSGDIGYFDEQGFLHLVDRKKDMLVSGGYNVFPADIERVITSHPDVLEATVIGIPHEKWGETPLAYVVLKSGSGTVTGEAMTAWINQRVGKHERVSGVRFLEALPRNAGGKILKRQLRNAFARSDSPDTS
jgi:acyl-CoA synthetase (AMP-forming)/AMP-acid ligase II